MIENTCWAYSLGLIDYGSAMQLQERLMASRMAGDIPDVLLFLEHKPVFTFGIWGGDNNIIVPQDKISSEGIPIVHTDRGGNITYHGPGQVVVYPIFDLTKHGKDLHKYRHNLEEVVIKALGDFLIPAYRDSQYPGVWVKEEKICALGIRVKKWVSKHGFALNVSNDLKYFSYICPCGIRDRQITSMSLLLGYPITVEDVLPSLVKYISEVFKMDIRFQKRETLVERVVSLC